METEEEVDKRWKKNIKDRTWMESAGSTRAGEDRTRWKGLLQSHLWCPKDLARLWD